MEISKHDGQYHLRASQWVATGRSEVFDFFSRSENLQRITPGWMDFHIVGDPPDPVRAGVEINYRLKVHGLPMRWRSEITAWVPGEKFVDEQRRGPYKLWRHEHTFRDEAGGTRVEDHVTYQLPGGPFAPLGHWLFVERDLRAIFGHRQRVIAEMFGDKVKG